MTRVRAEREPPSPRYDFDAIDPEANSVHGSVVRLVGTDVRVLELGTATGYMSKTLRDRGCSVVGIEIDPDMAASAEQFCDRMVVGDLDSLDFESELAGEEFDVIVAADVLEHLKDPLAVLLGLRRFLRPGGFFVLSVPNIAHGSVRLALLGGQFQYQDLGLLDATHLRFFTRRSLEQLLDEAELGLAELDRHDLTLDASEVPFDPCSVPAGMKEWLEQDPEARTYQFVVKAIRMEESGMRELQRRLREVPELQAKVARLSEVEEAKADLEKAIASIGEREISLRRSLVEAHDQLLRRDEEIEDLHTDVGGRDRTIGELNDEITRLRGQIVDLQVRLDGILSSPPLRLYGALTRFPGLRAIRQRRRSRHEAALAEKRATS